MTPSLACSFRVLQLRVKQLTSSLGDAKTLQVSPDGPPQSTNATSSSTLASSEHWARVSDGKPGPQRGTHPGRGTEPSARCRRRPALRGLGPGDAEQEKHRRGGGPNPGQPCSGGPGPARSRPSAPPPQDAPRRPGRAPGPAPSRRGPRERRMKVKAEDKIEITAAQSRAG
ncbi:translation initiation factor IF-2-like [Zalophus californianus]|uniref:Translation initiation factor IF-2-like n=1 Tax=Zalophus californianus TaxID=9704 RepID=A0A6J2BGW3_ZALCA|nr:translation initiation factor IF-2-like [Zalophus californianus]